MEATSAVAAAPAAAPAPAEVSAPATPAVSSTPSPSIDYSKVSDEDIISGAFGQKEDAPAAETPGDEPAAEKPAEEPKSTTETEKVEPKPEDEVEVDNAPVPEDLKRTFRAHPEVRAAWYRDRQFRESFATPAEAREFRQMFPTLDYAKTVMQQAATLLDADRLYQTDPATFVEKLSGADPKQFFNMLGEARTTAYQRSPEGYRSTIAEPVIRDVATNLREIAQETGNEELSIALDIVEGVLGLAPQKAAREEVVDPRIQEFERLKASAESAREEARQSFDSTLVREMDDSIKTLVSELVGDAPGVPEKARARMIDDAFNDLCRSLEQNGHVARTVDQMRRTGDLSAAHRKRISDFVLSHAKQLAPAKVRTRMNEWTNDLLAVNRGQIARAESVPQRKDVGVSTASGVAPAKQPGKIDYRKVSDTDIINGNF